MILAFAWLKNVKPKDDAPFLGFRCSKRVSVVDTDVVHQYLYSAMIKLYQHYKKQNYKYLGLVKHSETLEELVLYETRYDNPKGKIWVRPKDMFSESIQVDGQSVPRFRNVPLGVFETTNVTEAEVAIIAPIVEKAFGEWDPKWFYSRFNSQRKSHLLIGSINGQPVGFKLGYEHDSEEFYSWLGGVIPDYKGLGIASALINRQHEWCRKSGYLKIQTKTQNRFRDMLMLDLKHGFEVVGITVSDGDGPKVVLEKNL